MPNEPEDPFEPSMDYQFAAALRHGRIYVEMLGECGHFRQALRMIETLDQKHLASLALYVAAEARVREMDQSGDGDVWAKWWRGVDSPGEQNPTAMDTTPGMLLPLMRPVEDD